MSGRVASGNKTEVRSQAVVSLAVTLRGFCCLCFDGGGVFLFCGLCCCCLFVVFSSSFFPLLFWGGGWGWGPSPAYRVFCQLMSAHAYAC